MTINKNFLILLLSTLALFPISCTSGAETEELPVDRDVAIMIAEATLPSNVIGEASIQTLWDEGKWTVHFLLAGNETVTKNELGWPESPEYRFVNQGLLPAGTYRILTITIDRGTGAVLSRQASDTFLLGGPGIFNTEPPEMVSVSFPFWSVIASGVGGLVIGGMTVWFIMHRKKVTGVI